MTPATPPLDDADAMAVFADQLCAQGDPGGELVQLQLGELHVSADAGLIEPVRQLLGS